MTGEGAWAAFWSHFPYFVEVLATAAVTTVVIGAGALAVSMVLGVVFALMKTSNARVLRAAAHVYVEVFRGVPILTLLFILYFGLPSLGVRLEPLPSAIIGLGLHGGAYLTEIIRSGLLAVPAGQVEAAMSIGMPSGMRLRYIVLPQAMRVALPPFCNYALVLLKDTAMASAVAAPELTFRAGMLIDETYLAPQIYLLVALIYLVMCLPLTKLTQRLERQLGRGRAR